MTDKSAVHPRLIHFYTEQELHDHAEKLNQIGVSPDVPIMDSQGVASLASRTAPGGDGWGFAYYLPGEDGFMDCIHGPGAECCGGTTRTGEWKPQFPVTGLIGFDVSDVKL